MYKIVKVRVDPGLLREQRDAVLRDIEANLVLSREEGTKDHIEALDGIVNMLDYMIDECDGIHVELQRTILPDLHEIYNEGSD